MTQPMPGKPAEDAENELDIRGLFRTLWAGKLWIIGMGLAFALIALAYTFFARQEWSSTAITDRPTVNMLGGYYSQQQFLRNLDVRSNMASADQPSVMDEAYKEFVMQLASWDTRREFWLQTDYYKQRMVGNSKADAALLDEMINNIQFIPGDFTRAVNDSVKLIAETAPDANNLLRQYVAFASQRAASHLNDELKGAWAARTIQMKTQVKRQEEVAKAIYDRRMNSIEQALKIAEQHNISRSATDVPAEELPDSEMFLLGRPMLQARLENLQAVGPAFDLDYDQNRAMLNTLNVGPTLDPRFQTYRYLRTPEEPVKRDSPRRAFLMIMWGIVGGLIGAGVALTRRHSHKPLLSVRLLSFVFAAFFPGIIGQKLLLLLLAQAGYQLFFQVLGVIPALYAYHAFHNYLPVKDFLFIPDMQLFGHGQKKQICKNTAVEGRYQGRRHAQSQRGGGPFIQVHFCEHFYQSYQRSDHTEGGGVNTRLFIQLCPGTMPLIHGFNFPFQQAAYLIRFHGVHHQKHSPLEKRILDFRRFFFQCKKPVLSGQLGKLHQLVDSGFRLIFTAEQKYFEMHPDFRKLSEGKGCQDST